MTYIQILDLFFLRQICTSKLQNAYQTSVPNILNDLLLDLVDYHRL